ncbi:MAG: hypothetical protein WCL70_09130 [Paludibacter sp.]
MILNRKNLVWTVFLVLIFFNSCKDPHEYRVDSSFNEYLNRFETEAAARGHNFNVKTDGLIIEFATLTNNRVGLTHFETPIRIEVDKTYWSDVSKKSGADMMKEGLIFHELGHGLLGRQHLNTTLENGDWKSIMCGGTKVDNRSWNINYHGVRRKYYIDELFDINTTPPDISKIIMPVDTTGFKSVYQRNFNDTTQLIWKVLDDPQYKTSMDNGWYKFQSKVDLTYLIFAALTNPVSISSDFLYELTLNYPKADTNYSVDNQYGIVFGPVAKDGLNEPVEYLTINNNQRMFMGNRAWYSYFTELPEKSIVTTGINKLKMVKIGTYLYYFINNSYCYMNEIEAASDINEFGFIVPPKGTVWIDNFKISQKSKSGVIQQVLKQNNPVKIKMQVVDKLFHPVSTER